MKRYPWEREVDAAVRRLLWFIRDHSGQALYRPLGWKSLSTPNTSPVAMPGYKQEKP